MASLQKSTQIAFSAGENSASSASFRRYDLDWLRIIAILTLLFYHTGMIYVSWGWHIKSAEHSAVMEQVMRWFHRWRMPLLFFISGAGTFFALRRRSFWSYAGERVKRLFVPLVFGMFVIVPPQIYIEWLFRNRFSGTYAEFYPEVFNFQSYHDGGTGGAFSWHHLWFVAYLFLYSLLSIPVFMWLQRDSGQRFTDRIGRIMAKPGGAMWLGIVVIVASQLLLKPYFPEETHALVNDWAYFVKNLLLFWLGYVLISRPAFWQILTDQRRILLTATLICTVLMYATSAVYDLEGPDILAWEIFYLIDTDCLTWFSVLTTVAYSYRYLNVSRPVLPRLNEAVYPFYILHQTVIVLIGYYVLTRTTLGVYDGFLVVSFSSLAVCVAVYLLLIRPFKLIRIVFGLK
ncbi:acyltransferase family protein [Spirosoma agri]|uniref:Acyltransferase family protein n=1 Tax=Spirosoma agri TaxID=1987381 RepID=A0A6M0IGZ5_9BACT|nr:acyltransferase family protein [Spirosoma agri]NEU67550.1 acyltransferase family protein [Spirosoma agri]